MTTMTQVEYTIMELRENARAKHRQAEVMVAEAKMLQLAADNVERAHDRDKKRAADSANGEPK